MNRQPCILVVDDDVIVNRLLKHSLESIGARVRTATDGFQALQRLWRRDIELVMADYEMPGLGGEDFLEVLRAHECYRQLPVILITSRGFEVDIERLRRQYDLSAVFLKPFSASEVLAAATVALNASPALR